MYGVEIAGGQFGADWNGGHTFSQSAVDFSMQEYIEPEVVRKNPHLSPEEVHFEASRVLTLRLAQDLSFDRKENLRDEEMVTKWEVADIDGKKQLVTRYGDRNVSLEELWQHTEAFALRVGKPEAFNRAEMQTQLAIQDALIAGRASSAAFTLSHPESVRYVQQWQRGVDGAFYSTQIDIGNHAGRDLRHDEVKGFLDRFRDQHRDTAIEVEGAVAGSYVAVRGVLDTAAIPGTAKLHTMTIGAEPFTRRPPSDDLFLRSSPDTSDRAFPLWVIADRRWFGEYKREDTERTHHEGTVRGATSFDRIRVNEKNDTSESEKLIKTQKKSSLIVKKRLHQESSSEGRFLSKEYEVRQAARTSLKFIAETGVAVYATPVILASLGKELPPSVRVVEKSIARREKKELGRKKSFEKASTVGSAEPTRDKKEIRKAKREAKKEIAKVQRWNTKKVESFQKRKKESRRKKLEKRKRRRERGLEERLSQQTNLEKTVKRGCGRISQKRFLEKKEQRKEWRRGKRRSENGVKRVAAAELLTPKVLERRERRERRRSRRLRQAARKTERILEVRRWTKRERKLWTAFVVAVTEFTKLASQGQLPSRSWELQNWKDKPEKREPSKAVSGRRRASARLTRIGDGSRERGKERVAIAGVRFASILWLLLRRTEVRSSKTVVNVLPVGSRLTTLETRPTREETPWILLAIIWYLTAIREQGMRNNPQQHTTPLRQARPPAVQGFVGQANTTNDLPTYGVIFVHVHGMMGSYG